MAGRSQERMGTEGLMSNPNPNMSGLVGNRTGRPRKETIAISLRLSPELLARLKELQEQQDWNRTYAIEELLRYVFGMTSDYGEDMHLILGHLLRP